MKNKLDQMTRNRVDEFERVERSVTSAMQKEFGKSALIGTYLQINCFLFHPMQLCFNRIYEVATKISAQAIKKATPRRARRNEQRK